jgi:hypothetical protein
MGLGSLDHRSKRSNAVPLTRPQQQQHQQVGHQYTLGPSDCSRRKQTYRRTSVGEAVRGDEGPITDLDFSRDWPRRLPVAGCQFFFRAAALPSEVQMTKPSTVDCCVSTLMKSALPAAATCIQRVDRKEANQSRSVFNSRADPAFDRNQQQQQQQQQQAATTVERRRNRSRSSSDARVSGGS